MADGTQDNTKPVKGGRPAPVVVAPGVPPTDCAGECCGEHFSLRMAAPMIKAGREIEQGAMIVALKKLVKEYEGTDTAVRFGEIIGKIQEGTFTIKI